MANKVKFPADSNKRAKSIIDLVTGEKSETALPDVVRTTAAALGKAGGLKGGKARADKLSPKRRSEIAKKAAAARWHNKSL